MAQLKFRADLTGAEFPMLSSWASRTIMRPSEPEGTPPLTQPQILFCQDVLPTFQGYKSVSYKNVLPAASPANLNFSRRFNVTDAQQNKAIVGVTTDSKIYMLTSTSYAWVDVTPGGWAGGDAVSVGTANGNTYLFLKQFGCYLVNITLVSLTVQALTGVTAANMLGLFSSNNYLILWDSTNLYWSSTLNPVDFTPSLITGAGSSTPYDLEGKIVYCVQLNNGFVVYTNTNIVLASFSNNTQFPWIFRNANNGAGVVSVKDISLGRDLGFHIAYTASGLLSVTAQGCTVVTPEITDFLAARQYEAYNLATNTLSQQALAANLLVQVAVVAVRYIVVSYGISSLTDAIIYDTSLKRYGKLHLNHVEAFTIEQSITVSYHPYNEAGELGQTYASASPQPYNMTSLAFNNPPDTGRALGFLQADGTIVCAYLDFNSTTDTSVLLLGKYQETRNNLLQLSDVEVESLAPNTNFKLYDIPSLNGKDLLPAVQLTSIQAGTAMQRYLGRVVGKNHTLVFSGSFNLTCVELTAEVDSRR